MIIHTQYLKIVFIAGLILSSTSVEAFKYLTSGMECPQVKTDNFDSRKMDNKKALIVVFWATWSKRSLEQLDDLQEFYNLHREDGVEVVAINVEKDELNPAATDSIRQFYNSRNYTFPMIVDEGLELFYTFGVISVPSTALVDSTGILRFGPAGYSLTTKVQLFDSALMLLGLEVTGISHVSLTDGHRPDKRALRYYNLGLKLYLNSRDQMALTNLHKSISLDSLFAGPVRLIGSVWLKQGNLDSANKYINSALTLDSLDVNTITDKAKSLLLIGDTVSSQSNLNTALELDPFFCPARLIEVRILLIQGGIGEALAILRECEEYDKYNPRIYYLKGLALGAAKKPGEAAVAFLKAYRILTKE
jgi:tetratricopeptide (TPR) repeat protein